MLGGRSLRSLCSLCWCQQQNAAIGRDVPLGAPNLIHSHSRPAGGECVAVYCVADGHYLVARLVEQFVCIARPTRIRSSIG
jgi:hypothetical protein